MKRAAIGSLGLTLLVTLLSCSGARNRRSAPEEIREFDFQSAPASAPDSRIFSPLPALHLAVEQLNAAADDEACRGVFVRIGGFGGAWGRIGDLGEALQSVRDAGKAVRCHFDATDNAGYAFAARYCDHISMTPAGLLNLVGVAMQVVYIRTLLDQVGVEANILHMGRFKGAGDMFTETAMPNTARESLNALLDDVHASLVAALRSRDLNAQEVIDGGPYTSVAALNADLVDDILFDNQARDAVRQSLAGASVVRTFPPQRDDEFSLGDLLLSSNDSDEESEVRRIALVHVDGSIADGAEPRAGQATSGPFVRAMRDFADDENVAAIVVRIDSPGGSVVASDVMWQAVSEASEVKPVIASIGDVAASGGYYIASASDLIFAHNASIVGSIGVVGGKMSFANLAERMGVNAETLRRGQNSTLFTPLDSFSDSETAAFESMLRSAYYRFIRRVASGRDRTTEEILSAAEGRVMSGREGVERGLIDRVGGLQAALAEAQIRARGDEGEGDDLPLEVWPSDAGPLAAIGQMLGAEQSLPLADLGPFSPLVRRWIWLPELMQQESILAALPYGIEIR